MVIFNSRDARYKSCFGAIKSDKYERFRVGLPKDCGVWFCDLLIKRDGENDFISHPMTFEWCSDDTLYYSTDIKFDAGLYWYKFKYTTENEHNFITRTHSSYGEITDSGECWQQTVYDADFTVPQKYKGGIIYQIFPDRFYKSGEAKSNLPEKRLYRDDWGGQPEYRQTQGEKSVLGNDFFGGDLKGIEQKLDYLQTLGISIIYLNPIFCASSNHRYNTLRYDTVDPLLGDETALRRLCNEAHKRGISVILDGVFSHTGDDSIYFDRYHEYENGACDSENSPYRSWYKFKEWPNSYHSWWGVETLPEIVEEDENFLEYICGKDGILRRWIRVGIDGWRLDVADELPDVFLDALRTAVKDESAEAFIIGEVWEDASNKISYSQRRRYLLGKQLDSVMNYPFADAIVDFTKGGDAKSLCETVLTVMENYPPQVVEVLMNHIGTHDTARILTVLGNKREVGNREWQSKDRLSGEELKTAKQMLRFAAVIQYTLPGIPSLYYGDEAGMEGWGDPFCRGCYPWGNEDETLIEFYRSLGSVRRNLTAFADGGFIPFCADGQVFSYIRKNGKEEVIIVLSRDGLSEFILPPRFINGQTVFGVAPDGNKLKLPEYGYSVIKRTLE